MVNLADEGGILVSGDFDAGQVVPLTLTYADGGTTELNVPVVTACDELPRPRPDRGLGVHPLRLRVRAGGSPWRGGTE